jgi:tRNA-2-methylthio-N6-dimethylallyladenosine synthase
LRGTAKNDGYAEGHTRGNHPTLIPAAQAPRPGLYQVAIRQSTPHTLFGEVVGAQEPATILLVMA